MAVNLRFISQSEFARVTAGVANLHARLGLIADMCRANALTAVKRAGSGHLGSSFSAMDIVVWLYYSRMNTLRVGVDDPNRDIYFSSKGHDVPGLYSVLFSAGVLSFHQLAKLRRYGGLDGHPDIGVSGIEANSGSLGMGISKGRGIAWAKRARGLGGHVYVMTGDGELQEGQNFEALQNTVQQKVNLTVIVDHNKVQSDKLVSEIVNLGDLETKFRAFGWHVARCSGHDFAQIEQVFAEFDRVEDRPKVFIADTVKGRGVSFMEHPFALRRASGLYPWHAGAPDDASFDAAHRELIEGVNRRLHALGVPEAMLEPIPAEIEEVSAVLVEGEPVSIAAPAAAGVTDEYISKAYGAALVEIARERKDIVVLDGDLAADCKIRDFELTFPERFIENGIAEQDMISMAGGLARHGFLPVVNSFANFLAARGNEQIYNNATEHSKIIYACHYAGIIPAGPGKSHQSIRDISLFAALPNTTIVEPANTEETSRALRYFVEEADGVCVMRMPIGPSPRRIALPPGYQFTPGRGTLLRRGSDAVAFAYGPIMLHEVLLASEALAERGFGLEVVNMPWLNRADAEWVTEVVRAHSAIFVIDDHASEGGLGDHLTDVLAACRLLDGRSLHKLAVTGFPACGTPSQALRHHGLDGASLAARIAAARSASNAEVAQL